MKFPYPISDQLFAQIISEEGHKDYPIDEPEQFWALYLSCFDCTKHDGGRLTESVQQRLRALINSQLYRGDSGEIIGSKPSIPLQYAGNSFCLVGASTADEVQLLNRSGAVMPSDVQCGREKITLTPNDKPMQTEARNTFVLLQVRTAVAGDLHLGYCLAGGLANLISPDELEVKGASADRADIAATYDNAHYSPYLKSVLNFDPTTDADAIKRSAATRHMMDKGGKTLSANLQGQALLDALTILEEMSPNGGRQSFRAQAAATAIPDPSRILRDACPSDSTLEKLQEHMAPAVYGHWKTASKSAPAYFINDFVAATEEDSPYDPKRLRFPVSASFIGHLSPEKTAQLPLNAKAGTVGRDKYQFACVSLPALMRPGLDLYPHELNFSILSGIAFRFERGGFVKFMDDCAKTVIQDIQKGNFRSVVSQSNYNKIFRAEASVEEIVAQLKDIAYFNFAKFQADYLCEDKFLDTAYFMKGGFTKFKQDLEQLWTGSLPAIHAAVQKFKEAQPAGPAAAMAAQ